MPAAAYRAGECLYSDYYGEYSDYTRKGGVICSEILLPPHAPLEYQDRATLWNTVEQVEKHKKAQLAYSFDIALQNELSMEENIALAREFVQRCLVGQRNGCRFCRPCPGQGGRRHPQPALPCDDDHAPHQSRRHMGTEAAPGICAG